MAPLSAQVPIHRDGSGCFFAADWAGYRINKHQVLQFLVLAIYSDHQFGVQLNVRLGWIHYSQLLQTGHECAQGKSD